MSDRRGRRPRGIVGLAALLLIAALATGCTTQEGTGDKGYVTADGRVTEIAAAERGEPVSLAGESLTGTPVDVADWAGTPVVINIWGSWCAVCREETPDLITAHRRLGTAARFVGINIRDPSPAQAIRFEEENQVPYPSIYAPDGRALLALQDKVPPKAIPSTLVLDGEGRIAAVISGPLPSATTLVDVVRSVAEESADG